jgi:hypothetical protein
MCSAPRAFPRVVVFAAGGLVLAACGPRDSREQVAGSSRMRDQATQTQKLQTTERVVGCGSSFRGASNECQVKITDFGGGSVVYEISQPVVNQINTQYPMVVFNPGDKVLIRAGGCVQTGGGGRTWKRYVTPLGSPGFPGTPVPRSELYHGTITIPGVTDVQDQIGAWLEPSADFPNASGSFQVPASLPGPVTLARLPR